MKRIYIRIVSEAVNSKIKLMNFFRVLTIRTKIVLSEQIDYFDLHSLNIML